MRKGLRRVYAPSSRNDPISSPPPVASDTACSSKPLPLLPLKASDWPSSDFFRMMFTTPARASPPYTADEPTGSTSTRSTAAIGMRLRLK